MTFVLQVPIAQFRFNSTLEVVPAMLMKFIFAFISYAYWQKISYTAPSALASWGEQTAKRPDSQSIRHSTRKLKIKNFCRLSLPPKSWSAHRMVQMDQHFSSGQFPPSAREMLSPATFFFAIGHFKWRMVSCVPPGWITLKHSFP